VLETLVPEVIFPLSYEPGEIAFCDFTQLNGAEVTTTGEAFPHLLFHYRLASSGWIYAQVLQGGQSFVSLSEGLQNALAAGVRRCQSCRSGLRMPATGPWISPIPIASRTVKRPLLLPLVLLLAGPAAAQLDAALPTTDRLWVKVRSAISIEELATQLAQDETALARLNDVNEDHQFTSGDWLVLPSQSSKKAKQLAAIDTSELRRTPPLAAPPEPQEPARIRLGDSLAKIASRYNLSISELLILNPGLQAARLVAGTQIRVAPAIAPLAPRLPPPKRLDQSLDELVRQSVLSPGERNLVRGGSGALAPLDVGAFTQACRGGALSTSECRGGIALRWGRSASSQAARPVLPALPAPTTTKPLSPREQALLQRIRNGSPGPQWRTYGQCRYDWSGWRLHANGTRTTAADCSGTAMRWTVGVSCKRLIVATHTTASGWSGWERPSGPDNKSRQGEDEMVAALCANATR